jgi:predicted ArsR family transcriptional regulator
MPPRLVTASEVAAILGLGREASRALLSFLHGAGIAQERGTRPSATGRGRGENLFELPADVAERVGVVLRGL